MASLFVDYGDDVALRGVDDEEDDDTFPASYSTTFICWSAQAQQELDKNGKLRCSSLLIAADPSSSAFIDAYIKNKDIVELGTVYSGFESEDEIPAVAKSKSESSSHIYQQIDAPDILICQCKNKIQPEQSYTWVEQIFSSINNVNCEVVILTSALTCDYRSTAPLNEIKTPFLRVLYTNNVKSPSICSTLSEPNIISSLPAQVLTYSEINGIKASLYICYTDVINLDISTVKTYLPILSLPLFKSLQRNPDGESTLMKLVKINHDNSLLYL